MTYDIAQSDILAWAAQYEGPPFHALLCDPPYHLTEMTRRFGGAGAAPAQHGSDGAFQRASRGFMGKQWDGGDIAFRPETWAALAQHLHPGAFGMAFASTRGYHRMACAIEDAGLIIHTMLGWAFGCLSEDTEILTEDGWEPYHKAIAGTNVLCYNTASESLEWHAVQELYVYAYDDTAYHIHSDHTDQIVSRNHRCLVERGGSFVFRYAETLECQEVVPVLDSLPEMRHAVQCRKQQWATSALLRPDMRERGYFGGAAISAGQARNRAQGRGHHLSCMRQTGMEACGLASQGQGVALLTLLSSEERDRAAAHTTCGKWQGKEAARQGAERRAQSSMEGGRNLLQNARQLHWGEVCSLSSRIYGHGPQGWLCDGASAIRSSDDWSFFVTGRSGTPQGSQSGQQRIEQPATVRQQPRSQALRASRIAIPDLATVTPIHYQGTVWCVRVPTGAFVARRNGHIFITGNSGFPKATRIDVQIDRRAGVEREIVGKRKHAPKFNAKAQGYREKDNGYNSRDRESFDVTAPATDLAAAWEGHRYGGQAIKPAFEPIVVFQKPYQGRPVDSITRTGAGALWVSGARIGNGGQSLWAQSRGMGFSGGTDNGPCERLEAEQGRWPANLILAHAPACNGHCVESCAVRRMGEQSGESSTTAGEQQSGNVPPGAGGTLGGGWSGATTFRHGDSGTAARYFFNADWMLDRLDEADPVRYVAKASTAERELGLDGLDAGRINDGRQAISDRPYLRNQTDRHNIHPTVKPISLNLWLAKLLLPPDLYAPRRLLIPFAGVMSEAVGAMLAGWEEIQAVELETEHVEIGRARMEFWKQQRHKVMSGQAVKLNREPVPDEQLKMF